jgi:hypothetical protein
VDGPPTRTESADPSVTQLVDQQGRHCWVPVPVDGTRPRPGLLLEWRRVDHRWERRVVHAAELRPRRWPASRNGSRPSWCRRDHPRLDPYRYGVEDRATVHLRDGQVLPLPIEHGRLPRDLLAVWRRSTGSWWILSNERLKNLQVVDTPGLNTTSDKLEGASLLLLGVPDGGHRLLAPRPDRPRDQSPTGQSDLASQSEPDHGITGPFLGRVAGGRPMSPGPVPELRSAGPLVAGSVLLKPKESCGPTSR